MDEAHVDTGSVAQVLVKPAARVMRLLETRSGGPLEFRAADLFDSHSCQVVPTFTSILSRNVQEVPGSFRFNPIL